MSETGKCLVVLVIILEAILLRTCVAFPYRSFDYFKLALAWPAGYCQFTSCVTPTAPDFVIHGFWPALYSSNYDPTYCEPDVEYTTITDQTLNDKLTMYWPDFITGADSNEGFWEFQWKKHGTCSMLFYYQMGYFDLACEMREAYDILGWLANVGVRPSSNFPLSVAALRNYIQQYTSKYPQIMCLTYGRKKLLTEVILCFEAGGDIIDCPQEGNCQLRYLYFIAV